MANAPQIVDQIAWDIGILAQRLVAEYYALVAAIHVAADPRAAAFAPPIERGQVVSLLQVPRDDGTHHVFDFRYFLSEARRPQLLEDFQRAWLSHALLRVGDHLGDADYYNNKRGLEPEAELVRHLRNGIAHRNKFSFDEGVKDKKSGRLRFPAHNRRYTHALTMREYEIDTHLEGRIVLFDYGGPAAILDILTVLGWHLTRTARGFPVGTA